MSRCTTCQAPIEHGSKCTDCGGGTAMPALYDVNEGRDYRIEIFWCPEAKEWIGVALDLPGCVVSGRSRAEAASILDRVIPDNLKAHRFAGNPVPQPSLSPYSQAARKRRV